MDIRKILQWTQNPVPYEKGTAMMWTDPYIAKQLLLAHLDPDTDAASRKEYSIDATVDWALGELNKPHADVLDLGCGPGLYTEKIAQRGHRVTGVDFSKNSIEYAAAGAAKNGLDIQYHCMDYLGLNFAQKFDLVMMIYCDLGVLNPQERATLIANVYRALRPGGLFVFDALNARAIESRTNAKNWECSAGGFWRDKPYVCLSDSRHFPAQKAILDQYIVIEESGAFDVYRFYNHYFENGDIEGELEEAGFSSVRRVEGLLKSADVSNGEGVSFFCAQK